MRLAPGHRAMRSYSVNTSLGRGELSDARGFTDRLLDLAHPSQSHWIASVVIVLSFPALLNFPPLSRPTH
jgi:hypothetical protein